ncbi:hypothetical protein AOT83_23800 [Mycobacteroides sp. H001]|uniref:hypothetical protein n=1 Tax=Mycobacteroides TaxID=670516 RepID=UPI0007159290|nr:MULTISPECIES: hypothetical protein [Mycobacteroides]KRQ29546.1 hypothetical protein AOT86_05755 [Mycobacteroides sp. H072]KRQ37079.1 hypothetical protein AOT84_12560 [Mycobacteroides sp. H002]KRQ55660.1 hypothetical protein AOT85_01705 [Mycobacteroides sp. H054]KRQ66269.1 hypothetical protein AOT83_23800 [Mycobacteroides sp. H001]OHU32650.1 hypothetical protein BKG79_23970 [Mycobacteroides chelonae]
MNLYQLRDLIENSSAAEWVKVEPAGPTYRYRFEVSTDRDGGEQISVESHRVVSEVLCRGDPRNDPPGAPRGSLALMGAVHPARHGDRP